MATGFTALNDKTFKSITDPRIEAASRCLTILTSCARTTAVLPKGGMLNEKAMTAVADLMSDLLAHGQTLDADMQVLAGMLGCRIIVAEPEKGAQN